MAVITTRATAATFAALVTRVRDAIGDPSTTTSNQRWADAKVYQAITDQLAEMYNELAAGDMAGFLQPTTMTYTASADYTALPTGIEGNSIIRIEDYDSTTNPIHIEWRDPLEIDRHKDETGWTLFGLNIALRPRPSAAKTLRIWSIANFYPVPSSPAGTDQHALTVNHEELIVLGAAVRLQEPDDETPPARLLRLDRLWENFRISAARIRGPSWVRSARKVR